MSKGFWPLRKTSISKAIWSISPARLASFFTGSTRTKPSESPTILIKRKWDQTYLILRHQILILLFRSGSCLLPKRFDLLSFNKLLSDWIRDASFFFGVCTGPRTTSSWRMDGSHEKFPMIPKSPMIQLKVLRVLSLSRARSIKGLAEWKEERNRKRRLSYHRLEALMPYLLGIGSLKSYPSYLAKNLFTSKKAV